MGNQHLKGDDGIFVTQVIPEGAAEEEGNLSMGDRLLQVTSMCMKLAALLGMVRRTAIRKSDPFIF